jgi:hypothetical protein
MHTTSVELTTAELDLLIEALNHRASDTKAWAGSIPQRPARPRRQPCASSKADCRIWLIR